jgi:hypothetical protein
MNPVKLVKVTLTVNMLVSFFAVIILIVAFASRDSDQPTCKVAFHGNGTWVPIGWDIALDGLNNCDLPIQYGGAPVIVSPNGTWRYK